MSNVFGARTRPTRHELLKQQKRLGLARRAHKLLEEKYRILNMEREKTREILYPFEEKMGSDLQEAYRLLLEALRHSSLRKMLLAEALNEANDEFSVNWVALHGLTAPKFQSSVKRRNAIERGCGLSTTDPWIDDVASAFEETLELVVSVAETRNLLRILAEEAEKTHIRVVALEKFLIPQLEKEVRRIELILQERELEQFVTQKWIRESRIVEAD
ncbi:MAG TPA: V-type ATP synthase subunit D [Candidatus Desulfaltia sp.]|nr:V-type ATP synthase subunit D [Candidatus Desulfaltia sp.]